MLILDKNVQQWFKKFRIHCHNDLVVFKRDSLDSPQNNDEYFCGSCKTLQVSLSGSRVFVENITKENTQCVNLIPQNRCPFGISACTTFVSVSNGFWTNWSWSANKSGLASSVLLNVSRCPRGYCSCEHSACVLQSMLTIDRDPDRLCKGNRTGKLCGGCIPNYTQSMDEKTCISNQECKNNLWWVWTLLIIGFLLFSLYIVVSCGELNDGSIKCVFFYIQISSFASSPDETSSSYTILELLQFHSLGVMGACFAPDMGAYKTKATKLISSLFIILFSMVWTWVIQVARPQLEKRDIRIYASYSGVLAAAILFVFSNVSKIVFTLVECTSYDVDGVVFIDGTVQCLDNNWKILIAVVVLLCFFPVAFFAALYLNKLPQSARAVICRSFTEPVLLLSDFDS